MKTHYRFISLMLCIITILLCAMSCQSKGSKNDDSMSIYEPYEKNDNESTNDMNNINDGTTQEDLIPLMNSFAPTDEKAGTVFWNQSEVNAYSTGLGISRFLLTKANNPSLPFNIACHITDTSITAIVPSGIDLSKITVYYDGSSSLQYQGTALSSTFTLDLSKPTTLNVILKNGTNKNVSVDIQTLNTGLPSFALTVNKLKNISSREDYVDATVYLGGGSKGICPYACGETILVNASAKGRGNTSWSFPKKGYTIKLDTKEDLLGMGKSKNWVLVSSYQDKSLMRNDIASHLSNIFGLVTMETRCVDLWLNGKYWGTYLLIEKVEIEDGRIDIPEHDEVTNGGMPGFLLEWDAHVNEVGSGQKDKWIKNGNLIYDPVDDTNFIKMPHNNKWLVISKPSPKNITGEQLDYIVEHMFMIDTAIRSGDIETIKKYVDLESFAAWYLVEDIMKSIDALYHSSCYMHLDGNGILHMGPVWDFDMSLGNANYKTCDVSSGEYMSTCIWYTDLLDIPEFCDIVNSLLEKYKEELDKVVDYIDSNAAMLDRSQQFNFKKWDILGKKVGRNPTGIVQANTYQKQIDYMKNFYRERLTYVRNDIASRCNK